MIRALYGQDELVAQWVAHRLGFARGFGVYTAIGWADGDLLIAGTVFHNYSPEAGVIEMTTFAQRPKWLNRHTMAVLFGYVFGTVLCQLVVMRVSEKNTRMCSIARRFGFEAVLIPRLLGTDEAEFIFTLTREQWEGHRMRIDLGQASTRAA